METDSRRRLRTLIPLLVLATTGAMIETKASDFSIFGRHAIDTPASALAGFEGAEVRILRHDPQGLVAEVKLPIGVTVSARYADLVVVGQREEGAEENTGIAPEFVDELVLAAGRKTKKAAEKAAFIFLIKKISLW